MTREWKPGDVAIISLTSDEDHAASWTREGWRCLIDHYLHLAGDVLDARPLVVIDPEDREQAERLADLIDNAESVDLDNFDVGSDEWALNAIQAALREFANPTPPKPEEPTGLGAVVEDADGYQWVRFADKWVRDNAWAGEADYADIPAVRILSEGVPA